MTTIETALEEGQLVGTYMRNGLAEAGFDLPELADTMEEADARATASTYLFALRNIKRDLDANDAEFTVLQDYNRNRHVERQTGLIRQVEYLGGVIEKLFGFMTVTGKKKSLNLVGGRVGMRGQTDELVVDNDEAVIVWAKEKEFTALVRTKPVLDRKALRMYMVEGAVATDKATFPAPPGVELKERPDVFFATPATD